MTEKEKLLQETYDLFFKICSNQDPRVELLDDIVVKNIMGYGTTFDEKLESLDALKNLIETQTQQSEGLDMKWDFNPVFRHKTIVDNVAIFVDEGNITVKINDEVSQIFLRFTSVLEYVDEKWKVLHWHGSKPEYVESEADTFGIDVWKQKNEELEIKVAEKTADLLLKNRELEIEFSLEKIRARTMSMVHSDELGEVSYLLDQQVRALGIETRGCAFNIYGESESTEWFSSENGTLPVYKTPRAGIFQAYYENSKTEVPIYIQEFEGETCAKHYEYLCTIPVMGEALREMIKHGGSFPTRQIDHVTYFKYGYLLFITLSKVPEAHNTFMRFAKVFEQTYTRFLDLQKAEAQARDAQIEAALEKVRSTSLAMHKSDELKDVIREVLKKLQDLGIAMENRATAIFTYEKESKDYYQWVASPEYKTIINFLTPYIDHPVQNDIWNARQTQTDFYAKSYTVQEKNSLFKFFFDLPALKNMPQEEKEKALGHKYYDVAIAFEKYSAVVLVSHSGKQLTDIESEILKRFAKVFEQAYTRFLDLQKAEAQTKRAEQDLVEIKKARKDAEKALAELQATQKQLIQSEKMASLGELTAGIAHEIQNPLNFVNNFSEVSEEMIDEMYEELEKGDLAEVKAISKDIKDNLAKINHHGQRASSIVKGMLEHSRTSSGKKEPTDINALCDEYLRLTYHGLRAKDNTFNATMKTDFDTNLKKINIIPQDIGRVVLNLLTNAFYAVNEKNNLLDLAKQTSDANPKDFNYNPTVTISTKLTANGQLQIAVTDNGNGMPKEIMDKVFQPFFTTKPTGKGTGLGLSLAYDIVKAHGGEIKVDTKEQNGTCFIISLPFS